MEIVKERHETSMQDQSPKLFGKRKVSKSENRQSSQNDSPYEGRYRKKMNKALKDLTTKRVDRQDRFNLSATRKGNRKCSPITWYSQ